MATLGNKKAFSGMVGNLVFRYRDGKQIVQSHPGSIKQTLATKKVLQNLVAAAVGLNTCAIPYIRFW